MKNSRIQRMVLNYTPPLLFAGVHTLLGGLLPAVLLLPKRIQISWNKNCHIYFISSLFNVVLFFGLQTVGLKYLPAGLFSVIFQPVLIGIFAWIWLGERMRSVKVIGLIWGFFGIGVVSVGGVFGLLSSKVSYWLLVEQLVGE